MKVAEAAGRRDDAAAKMDQRKGKHARQRASPAFSFTRMGMIMSITPGCEDSRRDVPQEEGQRETWTLQ
jgi:hypothetical protein